VKTDAIADEARRRSDDAVRRLRAESAHRVERDRRGRAFFSWCALATLASGISLAALDAHEDDIDPPPALAAPVAETPPGPAVDQPAAWGEACWRREESRLPDIF
jgi:hypothetical protein